ncbi:winged helix-turn-helix transcriptional regulator [Streptomyces sp. NPDC001220]
MASRHCRAAVDSSTLSRIRADCPARPILDQIAHKWSLMVMAVLEEPRRFNDIKRRLEGITQRVLTQTLRRLERNGMVVRTVLPTSPVGGAGISHRSRNAGWWSEPTAG